MVVRLWPKRRHAEHGRIPPEAVLDDLTLLFHPVCLERLSHLHLVGVQTLAHAEPPMEQIAELSDRPSTEVRQGSPVLVLSAVSDLVSQHGHLARAVVRQKDMIAERHRAT